MGWTEGNRKLSKLQKVVTGNTHGQGMDPVGKGEGVGDGPLREEWEFPVVFVVGREWKPSVVWRDDRREYRVHRQTLLYRDKSQPEMDIQHSRYSCPSPSDPTLR